MVEECLLLHFVIFVVLFYIVVHGFDTGISICSVITIAVENDNPSSVDLGTDDAKLVVSVFSVDLPVVHLAVEQEAQAMISRQKKKMFFIIQNIE